MLQTLPQLRILDCKNIFGEPINMAEINSSHLQCFEGLLDNLVSSEILAIQIQLLSLTELRKTQKTNNIHFS